MAGQKCAWIYTHFHGLFIFIHPDMCMEPGVSHLFVREDLDLQKLRCSHDLNLSACFKWNCRTNPEVQNTVIAQKKWFYLWMFHLNVTGFLVNHTKRDTPGVWGKHPADSWPTVGHSNSNDTVTTGPDEQLSGTITKLRNLIHAERDSLPERVNTLDCIRCSLTYNKVYQS